MTRKLKNGCHENYTCLIDNYTRLLIRYCRRHVGHEVIAEEIVYKVFRELWLHIDRLPNKKAIRVFLMQSVYRHSIEWLMQQANNFRRAIVKYHTGEPQNTFRHVFIP